MKTELSTLDNCILGEFSYGNKFMITLRMKIHVERHRKSRFDSRSESGYVCGLWLGNLAIFNLLKDLEQSMFEHAAELLLYLAVYPALITVVLVVALFHYEGSRIIAGTSGGAFSCIFANLRIQISFMILQLANDLQITFEFSEVASFSTLINGAMLGVLVAFAFRIPNTELARAFTSV